MTPRSRHLNPWVLFVPSLLIVVVVVAGILGSSAALLSVGLVAGLILTITYLFTTAAHLHALDQAISLVEAQVADATAEIKEVRDQLAKRAAFDLPLCDSPVVEIARPRSA